MIEQVQEKQQKKCIDDLALSLQPHYSKFNVANRLLFTGHSHQAWPDCAFQGFQSYQKLVSTQIDHKWGQVYSELEKLRDYLKIYYDDSTGQYCRQSNTHMLIVSWLSSLDLKSRPKIVTTDSEFHSAYRQLELYNKAKICELVRIQSQPVQTLSSRLLAAVDNKTSAVICSRVFFTSGKINKNISQLAKGCREHNAYLLIDDYHGTNVAPLSFKEEGLDDVFMVLGGYKYLQWGEGLCFLRYPKQYKNVPIISGWMSAFGDLTKERVPGEIGFDQGGNRFCSGTFDPVSIFRASKVIDFFNQHKLTSKVLRKQYVMQNNYFRKKFKSLGLDKNQLRFLDDEPADNFGGFVSLTSNKISQLSTKLDQLQVFHDSRGKIIRFGFAPYITTSQIDSCIQKIGQAIKSIF